MKFKKFLNEYTINCEGSRLYGIDDIIKFVESVGKTCFKARMRYDSYKIIENKVSGTFDYHKLRFWIDAGFMDSMIVDVEMEEDTVDRITEQTKYPTITEIVFYEVAKVNGKDHPYLQYLKHYYGNVVNNYTVKTVEVEPPTKDDNPIHMLEHTLTLKKGKEGINIDTYFNKYAK